MRILVLLIAFLTATSALASYRQESVRVCGETVSHTWYGDLTPGIYGTSSNGLQGEYFRIRAYYSVIQDDRAPSRPRHHAILDFRTLVRLDGVKICVTGDLYGESSKKEPGKTLYSIEPHTFEFGDRELLLVSSTITRFSGIYNSAPIGLEMLAGWDRTGGPYVVSTKDFSAALYRQLRDMGVLCRDLVSLPNFRYELTATSKLSFTATSAWNCDKQRPSDLLEIRLSFSPDGLTVDVERALKNTRFSFDLSKSSR